VHDITERKKVQRDLHRILASLLALYEAGRVFASSLEQEQICSELLAMVRRLPGLSMASVELRDGRGVSETPRVFVSAGEVWRLRDAPEVAAMRRLALRTGRAQHAGLPFGGPKAGPTEALLLPLGARGGMLGILESFGSEALGQKDNRETLASLAGQAASALENARLYEELAERERRLHELVRQLLTAQEEERRRVAHDVHDGLAQTAAAAYQALQVFARRRQSHGSSHSQELEEALELVRQTVGEARQVIYNLRPTVLDDFGLAAAVRLQVEALRSDGLDVGYEEGLGDARLPAEVETALFRVAQEALTNVRKHARTSRAHVSLEHLGGTVRLLVRDEGGGFRPEEATNGAGPGEKVGLSGMRERVALLGGRFEIQTGPQAGTSILAEVRLPATGKDADHG
jgi:signal transduction histidine kinase